MERLLAILFSVSLFLATSPPRVLSEACDYAGGICTVKESCLTQLESGCDAQADHAGSGCGEDSDCSLPMCCVSGPCCCLCIVPERPGIHRVPVTEELRERPNGHRDFFPQIVCRAIWKPPAFRYV